MNFIDAPIDDLYAVHVCVLVERYARILADTNHEQVLIHSGTQLSTFLDDKTYPFQVNPHFKAWLPLLDAEQSLLLIKPGIRPILFYYQADDYWHKPAADPSGYWTEHFDMHVIRSSDDAHNLLGDLRHTAFVGDHSALAEKWQIAAINPADIINPVHYARAYKTDYEKRCVLEANRIGSKGHEAARLAFLEGHSEFEIQHEYLAAIRHRERETPYTSIVGLNENCAALHYQHYQTQRLPPDQVHSMLIDAGAAYNGYASDITRTYSRQADQFSDLIDSLEEHQQGIIGDIELGMNYLDLHLKMHLRIGQLLKDAGLVDMTPLAMVETGVTSTFLPHGLGHFLGLQTHDVAGHQQNSKGDIRLPPSEHAALRNTRKIENEQIFTIEPGIYFIDSLLQNLSDSTHSSSVSWDKIDQLRKYGGIRIEDNVCMHEGQTVNLTRIAFAER